MKPQWLLALVILAYLNFAADLIKITPYRTPGRLVYQRATVPDIGAPDERQHANYVNHLLTTGSLPVFRPGSSDLYETYQSHQPPLYYAIAAGWCKIFSLDPTETASGPGLRSLNALLGAVTLVGIWMGTRWATRDDTLAVIAAALAGLMPMYLALHAAVSNDPLLICGCTWTLALSALILRDSWCWWRALVLGLVVGLSLLTKTSALSLIVVVAVLGLLTRSRLAIVPIGIAVLMALPIWMRNQSLYGDPLAMGAFRAAFAGSAQREQMMQMVAAMREQRGLTPGGAAADYWLNWFGWWTARSFVGAFSQMDIFFSDLVYRVALVILGIFGFAGIYELRRPVLESTAESKKFLILTATLLAVVSLLFLQFNLTYFQAQARYLYPAIFAIALGLALGVRRLTRAMPMAGATLLVLALGIADFLALPYVQAEFNRRLGG